MKFINDLKDSIGQKHLSKEIRLVSRSKRLINLKEANNIGILFKLTDEHSYSDIRTFVKKLREDGKAIKCMAYIDAKSTPLFWIPKASYDYFTKKALNSFNIPKTSAINNFVDYEFDILLNLTIEECFPLDYIVGTSKAKFKVGNNEENSLLYDFMINTKPNIELKEYFDQIYHYLNLLNA